MYILFWNQRYIKLLVLNPIGKNVEKINFIILYYSHGEFPQTLYGLHSQNHP